MEYSRDELLGFIKASSIRMKILETLYEKDRTPSEIAKITNIALGNVTKILGELRKMNLVICKTPRLKKGRIYSLSEKGREILSIMSK